MRSKVDSGKIVEVYYVVFTNSRNSYPFRRYMKKGFTHVYAIKKSAGGGFWQVVNPLNAFIDLELWPSSRSIRDIAGDDAIIIKVIAKIEGDKFRGTICLFNCVEVVKALLGIKSFWTWTPYQLYKLLRSYGHERYYR